MSEAKAYRKAAAGGTEASTSAPCHPKVTVSAMASSGKTEPFPSISPKAQVEQLSLHKPLKQKTNQRQLQPSCVLYKCVSAE